MAWFNNSTAIGFSCFLALIASISASYGAEPSLDETLHWMDSTFNNHSSDGGAYGHGKWGPFADSELTKAAKQEFNYKSCDLNLTIDETTKRWAEDQQLRYVLVKQNWQFNLKDINPNSIRLNQFTSQYGDHAKIACSDEIGNCNLAELGFETTNQTPLIKVIDRAALGVNPSDYNKVEEKVYYYGYFIFDDVEYAKRFTSAFTHAVKLCGGKAPPF